ncbi:MAG: hypothetical protein ACFE9T_14200 [Promethearchaeota archaeon]
MENLEIKIPKAFRDKFEELVKNVPLEEVSELQNSSFIIGFYRYWLLYQSILNDLTDKELSAAEVTERSQDIYRKIKTILKKAEDIDSFERKFESTPLSNNTKENCDQYYIEFVNYLESPPELEVKEIPKEEGVELPILQKKLFLARLKAKRRERKELEKPGLPFKLLPRPDKYALHKHGLYLGLSVIICYFSFFLLSRFAPQIWILFPYYFFAFILLFILIFVGIFGFIAIFYYYFFPSFEDWQVNRERGKIRRELKKLRREFKKTVPSSTYNNPIIYSEEFSKFIKSKYKSE